jgi:hypothetical protein
MRVIQLASAWCCLAVGGIVFGATAAAMVDPVFAQTGETGDCKFGRDECKKDKCTGTCPDINLDPSCTCPT